ncbi:LOW QUALITY PROTEIN: hypothetical protein ACHAW6_001955 [Cyclotella cf. meneghiniana]
MDVTQLITELQKPWDMVEMPATLFARGNKYECQLIKVGQATNPSLHLAFAIAMIKASANTMQQYKSARDPALKTLPWFQGFIQKKIALRHKMNKSFAGSVGHGIANSVQQHEEEAQFKQRQLCTPFKKLQMQCSRSKTSNLSR